MKSQCSVYVKCPYYRREEKQKIFCEGVSQGTSIHLAFGSPQQRKQYETIYCKGDWSRCLLAQMQNRKWDYEI